MAKMVVLGARLKCSEGLAPSALTVLPRRAAADQSMLAATVNDFTPMVNVAPFGMCKTQANPQVAAATSAAMGVLTPMPCVPVLTAPWSPGAPKATIDGVKILTDDSTCSCMWSGTIEITDAGSTIDVAT
jgi:uncharacterized protein DUF4280